jgi:hypothetical protein
MLAGMRDYIDGPYSAPPRQRRRAGHVLGDAARVLLITAAVILAVGGLAVVGFMVVVVVGLNSLASNK